MSISEIDVAGATEALDAAGGFEHLMASQDEPQTPAPAQDPQPVQQPVPQGNQVQQQVETSTPPPAQQRNPHTGRWEAVPAPDQPGEKTPEDTPFTGLDPNALSPELKQVYRLMQGDYTRKTQELAQQRKQYETYGDPEFVQQAVETYQQLQDPANWKEFHTELSEALQQYGLSPAEADAQAGKEVVRQVQQEQGQPTGLEALSDPDLAPVKSVVEGLQKQVEELKGQWATREEEQQVENLEQAVLGELTRQENLIRQTHKNYDDQDVNMIYELSSFHDGNLLSSQQKLEDYVQSRLAKYLDQKQGAAPPAPLPGAAVQSVTPPENKPRDLDEAHVAAMEQIRALEAAGQL